MSAASKRTEELTGLPPYEWPGTWVANSPNPIVIDRDVRGTLQYVSGVGSGNTGDWLESIQGARIQYGMLAYVDQAYTSPEGLTRTAKTYYQYNKIAGQADRSTATGALGNTGANWTPFTASGSAGITGPIAFIANNTNTDVAVGGGTDPLARDLVYFFESDGSRKPIREQKTYLNKAGKNMLQVILASFTPIISSAFTTTNLNWDDPYPLVGNLFTVTVDNPGDYTDEFISSVRSITASAGTISALSGFTGQNKSATPAGGVDWNQSFIKGGVGDIKAASTGGIYGGGVVTATIRVNRTIGGVESEHTDSAYQAAAFSANWKTPTISVSGDAVGSKIYLSGFTGPYNYTISIGNITNSANYGITGVTGTAGLVSNVNGNGTISFNPAYTPVSITVPKVKAFVNLNRPSTVTGSVATLQLSNELTFAPSFTYPSFYLWTSEYSVTPTVADIINSTSTDFRTATVAGNAITQLANQSSFAATAITNPFSQNASFWFFVSYTNKGSAFTQFKGSSTAVGAPVDNASAHFISAFDLSGTNLPANTARYYIAQATLSTGTTYITVS